MATREELLREMISDSRRKIERHTTNISEWEMELRSLGASLETGGADAGNGVGASGASAPGSDPLTLVRNFEFATKSQPESIKLYLQRYGYPLTTDQLLDGLEKGGLTIGGADRVKKKNNLATILTRTDGIVRVGRGAWNIGTKKPKSAAKDAKTTSSEKADDDAN